MLKFAYENLPLNLYKCFKLLQDFLHNLAAVLSKKETSSEESNFLAWGVICLLFKQKQQKKKFQASNIFI